MGHIDGCFEDGDRDCFALGVAAFGWHLTRRGVGGSGSEFPSGRGRRESGVVKAGYSSDHGNVRVIEMQKPWFVAALLGAFAALLAAHLGMLAFAGQRCASYGANLITRMERAPIGSPAAKFLHNAQMENGMKCSRLIDDFQRASGDYQATILALLSGASISAGAGVIQDRR